MPSIIEERSLNVNLLRLTRFGLQGLRFIQKGAKLIMTLLIISLESCAWWALECLWNCIYSCRLNAIYMDMCRM